jgi:hypothetical protein
MFRMPPQVCRDLRRDEETRLVLFVGIGVPSDAPSLLVIEVANPAEMHRDASQPCDPLIARLTRRWGTASRKVGFRVHIDIAERVGGIARRLG